MPTMLRCNKTLPKIAAACRNLAHQNESSRRKAGRVGWIHWKGKPSEVYPPHEKGEDARSITFIMRFPFGIDTLAG